MEDDIKFKINLEEIKKGIEKFLEEDTPIMVVNDVLFTSTQLGELEDLQEKGTAKGRKMNEILAEMGFLEENTNRKKGDFKWKLTSKGKKYGFTPFKYVVSYINDNKDLLIAPKEDTPRWTGAIRKEIENYIKEKKENGKE